MACAWHESLLICGSNFAMVPAVLLALRRGMPFIATYFASVMTASFLYHLCGCGVACVAFPFSTYAVLDFSCSYGMIPVLCVLLLGIRSWHVRVALYWMCFLVCLALVLTDRSNWIYRFALLGVGFAAVLAKVAIVACCRRWCRRQCYRYGALALGLCSIGIGATFFAFGDEMGVPYWIGHSIWHAAVFAGTYALVYGVPCAHSCTLAPKPHCHLMPSTVH